MQWLIRKTDINSLKKCQRGFNLQQKHNLVNIKLKWVKDKELDDVVSTKKSLRAVSFLVSILYNNPKCPLPIYHLRPYHRQLGIPHDVRLLTFMRRYPLVFESSYVVDSGGTRVPSFFLTPESRRICEEEIDFFEQNQIELVNRLRKLLMLTTSWTLPLQTIDQLNWDMGLPNDYQRSLLPNYQDLFSFVRLPDDRVGLRLTDWDDNLAVSELQKNAFLQQYEEDIKNGCLAFPIGFTRGFGLKRKCLEWLKEWQKLPYTSPYNDSSHLDPRTDVSEKRIVGVFHELLHLSIEKKTERRNVSNLRKPLNLPQKFTKVFERHPGIFYISMKGNTQTVILREAYESGKLLQKHPLVEIRERLACMLRNELIDETGSCDLQESSWDDGHGCDSDEPISGSHC